MRTDHRVSRVLLQICPQLSRGNTRAVIQNGAGFSRHHPADHHAEMIKRAECGRHVPHHTRIGLTGQAIDLLVEKVQIIHNLRTVAAALGMLPDRARRRIVPFSRVTGKNQNVHLSMRNRKTAPVLHCSRFWSVCHPAADRRKALTGELSRILYHKSAVLSSADCFFASDPGKFPKNFHSKKNCRVATVSAILPGQPVCLLFPPHIYLRLQSFALPPSYFVPPASYVTAAGNHS